ARSERLAQRKAQRLERGFEDVVAVASAEHAEVERNVRIVRERAEEVVVDPDGERAPVVGAAAGVEGGVHQRVVHGDRRIAVALAGGGDLVPQRKADGDGHVLNEVVAQVAGCLHLELEAGIPGEGLEHVVQEPVGGPDRRWSGFLGSPPVAVIRAPIRQAIARRRAFRSDGDAAGREAVAGRGLLGARPALTGRTCARRRGVRSDAPGATRLRLSSGPAPRPSDRHTYPRLTGLPKNGAHATNSRVMARASIAPVYSAMPSTAAATPLAASARKSSIPAMPPAAWSGCR